MCEAKSHDEQINLTVLFLRVYLHYSKQNS